MQRSADDLGRIDNAPTVRTYVVDTSVPLSDPGAWRAFAEHQVVVPLTVITELEGKRHHPELGWTARQALRGLERLRLEAGGLDKPIPVTAEGGTLRVELESRLDVLPSGLRAESNDHRILAVAASLLADGADVVLVSKDLPLRLKAAVVGVPAQEYRREMASDTGWTGMVTLEAPGAEIDQLYSEQLLDTELIRELPCNTGVVLSNGRQSALGRVRSDKLLHLVSSDRGLFGVQGRSGEQRLALDVLGDPAVGIVSLGGPAGTGKSVLALAAGLEAVLERRSARRIVVFRPLYAVGGQELGYLPGSADEKMAPWAAAVFDALEAIAGPEVVEEVLARNLLEVLPLTHIRGRTLSETFIIVDEVQNIERTVLLTALSRLGEGSRAVLCWDIAQRDNLHVGRHDGIVAVIEGLRGHPLFAHIGLARSERSPLAALAATLLDERPDF